MAAIATAQGIITVKVLIIKDMEFKEESRLPADTHSESSPGADFPLPFAVLT